MITRIKKWGNGQGILLPKALLDSVSMACGTEVEIVIEDKHLIILPVKPSHKRCDLNELFQNYDGDYKTAEVSWGHPVGREEW